MDVEVNYIAIPIKYFVNQNGLTYQVQAWIFSVDFLTEQILARWLGDVRLARFLPKQNLFRVMGRLVMTSHTKAELALTIYACCWFDLVD